MRFKIGFAVKKKNKVCVEHNTWVDKSVSHRNVWLAISLVECPAISFQRD